VYWSRRGLPLQVLSAGEYLTQLYQASAALTHLLDAGVPAGHIVICGDFAGVDLGFALLSYLLPPYPDLPHPRLTGALPGVFFISPLVHRNTHGISMQSQDDLHPCAYVKWLAAVPANGASRWAGASSLLAPDGWCTSLAAVTGRVLVTIGGAEVLSPGQVAVVHHRAVEALGTQVECVKEEGATHNNPICDLAALRGGPGKAAKRFVEWVAAV
jgi:hypothetical protein